MNRLDQWLHQMSHHYVIIAIAAILFFATKAVIGYITYRHYDKQLKDIDQKLNNLLEQHQNETNQR